MQSFRIGKSLFSLSLAFAVVHPALAMDYEDHYEFEASINAPFRAQSNASRTFGLNFRFPGAEEGTTIAWRLDIVDARGVAVRSWRGQSQLADGEGVANVDWSEHDPQNGSLSSGIYKATLHARPLDAMSGDNLAYGTLDERVDHVLALDPGLVEEQSFDIQIGAVAKPVMPAFKAMHTAVQANSSAASVAATGGVPYTVFLGNLHSQTNLSDGGGDLSTCVSEQSPQTGVGSPTNAYQYALNEGLDFLMTSEHNHMFDGSTSTNASANPTTAKNLYQSGQTAASSFNAAHPGFLALAGLEWGVISNGGHMNIFNTPKLLEWEYNSSNQLIGDIYTAKGDYAALYTLMKANGWIGQFNHAATSGQFVINSTALAYTADGDQAMVLCEVMNSSAFSHNTTETETSRSSYEGACNILLEAGYHVAFSSDQDNHCANWGASYTNRTGVLIPNGLALNQQNFLDALRARHVYATYDKTSQIVLTTGNGHVMGDQFSNSGSLTLTVNYAPGAGRSASQVQIFQGVPGSNGTVSVLSTASTATITPAVGNHFYYAKLTQDNGTLLFSAPVWVNQGSGGGGTPTANFTSATSGLTATFTDTSTDSGGTIGSHAWTFGDGGTSTAASPSHTYASAGTYSVTETVADSVSGATNAKTSAVTVAAGGGTPTANFSYLTNGLVATFTDSSSDAGGTIGSHAWTFGDGATSTATNPSHTYAAAGSYSVTETVTDSVNATTSSKTTSLTLTQGNVLLNGVAIVIADATANHQQNWTMPVPAGATSLTFNMSGGSGDADLYVKFGSAPTTSSYDCRPYVSGNSESCPIGTAQAGTYYVMVNAYAAYSGVSLVGSYTAAGSGGTPSANFTSSTSGLTATFTDSSTDSGGTIGSHSWTFGDGGTSTATNPSHTYAAGGTYSATETVTDSVNGKTSSKTASITVNAGNVLSNGVPVTGLSGSTGTLSAAYTLTVPSGKTSVTIRISGGTGDADLYVNLGSAPTLSTYQCRPYLTGNSETCTLTPPAGGGVYYVKLNAYSAYSGVSLTGSFSP